jgi:hypothetical protein
MFRLPGLNEIMMNSSEYKQSNAVKMKIVLAVADKLID